MGTVKKKADDLENQFAEMKKKTEEVMLSTQKKNQNQDVAKSLESELRAEVKKEVEKVLPDAVKQGLRDLPYEMVCAFKDTWDTIGVVTTTTKSRWSLTTQTVLEGATVR